MSKPSKNMKGPYFKGQIPAKCGHYYPDIMRVRDEKKSETRYVRVIDCEYCGQYELELDLLNLDGEIVRNLLQKGVDIGLKESEIAKVKAKKKREFLEKQDRQNK